MKKNILKIIILVGIGVYMITGCTNEQTNKMSVNKITEDINGVGGIDYDLTSMSSEMVYALIYQMMVSPDDYVGKKIKISGTYYAAQDKAKPQYYHYVIIKDATACCAQGLQFVWEDGAHIYPDDYPDDEEEVEVIGVFETYIEDGDTREYCRLTNSQLKLLDK